MKNITPKVLGTLAMAALLSTPVKAQGDCNLTFTFESACYAEDLGYGLVTDIEGAISPWGYLWSNGAVTQYVDGLMNGDHWVMVTDAAGCSYKVDFNLDCAKDEECDISFTFTSECYDDDLGYGLVTDIMGGVTPYEFLWSNGAVTQYVDGLMSGDHWVMVTDAEGCSHKVDFNLDCEKDEEPCQLRTQTQGGWGAPANGNNPGVYRDANFASAFPAGLTIGCDRTLTLTTAAAVQAFLPSGTTARMLNVGNMVDPGNSYRNVLAGQLVALTLSVGFDLNDPDFGMGGNLADAMINTGMFQGWTVSELLTEANSFIGGCGSTYTASQLNSALSMVNENFVDGTTNNGNLDCTGFSDKKLDLYATSDVLAIFPNPATDRVTIDLTSSTDGAIMITMLDALGRTVSTTSPVNMLAGDQRNINLSVDQLQNGSYFLMLTRNGEVIKTQRVVVAH